MTKFMDKSFSTYAPSDDSYRDNWERTFGKKPVSGVSHRCPASAPADAEAQATKWLDYNWPDDNWEVMVPALAKYMTDFAERRSASASPPIVQRDLDDAFRDGFAEGRVGGSVNSTEALRQWRGVDPNADLAPGTSNASPATYTAEQYEGMRGERDIAWKAYDDLKAERATGSASADWRGVAEAFRSALALEEPGEYKPALEAAQDAFNRAARCAPATVPADEAIVDALVAARTGPGTPMRPAPAPTRDEAKGRAFIGEPGPRQATPNAGLVRMDGHDGNCAAVRIGARCDCGATLAAVLHRLRPPLR